MTVIFKNPCEKVEFVTTPSPFSDLTFTMPLAAPVDTPFHVLTNIEQQYPTIQANITAWFTTPYMPLNAVIAPGSSILRFDPTMVSLPADIGTHPVTVRIRSKEFPFTVPAVFFSFNVIVNCFVTSFTLGNPGYTSLDYVINTDPVSLGPFNAVAVNDCNHPVTFTVAHYSNGVFVDSNISVFDPLVKYFTFKFTDPALVGTTQRYVLTATMVTALSGTLSAT